MCGHLGRFQYLALTNNAAIVAWTLIPHFHLYYSIGLELLPEKKQLLLESITYTFIQG